MPKKDSTKVGRSSLKDNLAKLTAPNHSLSDLIDLVGYSKLIRMIDNGVDDFNSANQDCCLSLIMAARYMGIISALETMQDQHFQPAPRLLKKYRLIHGNLKQDLKHVLDIYKKLKNGPKGLNWPVLNAYEAEHPNANLTEQFQKMDAHLIHKPRFSCPALMVKTKE